MNRFVFNERSSDHTYKNPFKSWPMKARQFRINQTIRKELNPDDPDFDEKARAIDKDMSGWAINVNMNGESPEEQEWKNTGRQDVLSIDDIIDEMKNGDPKCRQASIALHKAATTKDTGFITKVLSKLHVLAREYEIKYSNTKVSGPKTLFKKMAYYISKAIRYLTARLYKFMHKNESYTLQLGTLKQVVME